MAVVANRKSVMTLFSGSSDIFSHRVRIVGYDEADMQRGEISIGSPVARALMGKAAGDGAEVETPQGVSYLDIEEIA